MFSLTNAVFGLLLFIYYEIIAHVMGSRAARWSLLTVIPEEARTLFTKPLYLRSLEQAVLPTAPLGGKSRGERRCLSLWPGCRRRSSFWIRHVKMGLHSTRRRFCPVAQRVPRWAGAGEPRLPRLWALSLLFAGCLVTRGKAFPPTQLLCGGG